MDTFGQLAGSPVRPPTAAEMTAVAHPTRLRILRLCHRQPLTNQELAGHLGIAPATTLRHVRILDKAGFLAAQPVRNGQHGSLERPYRSTGLSVRLGVAGTAPADRDRDAARRPGRADRSGPGRDPR
jgi:DNA-binding transcriptional ArsR family regulator